jgi:hypothetical protein
MIRRVILLLGLGAAGCSVGGGTGEAKGPVTILDCGGPGKTFPDPMKPEEYSLEPQFFAAEQLLDLSGSQRKVNRLIIRLQNTGRRREANDILRFDIPDLFEAARCVRGKKKADGSADYDESNCFVTPQGTRLRIGTNALVRAFLTPNFKCSTKLQLYDHVGTATSTVRAPSDGTWASYIVFSDFGRANSPEALKKDLAPNFKIELDDRLRASEFVLFLEDDGVVTARLDPLMPPLPSTHISGMLKGLFDFDMQRGQGAQTFP